MLVCEVSVSSKCGNCLIPSLEDAPTYLPEERVVPVSVDDEESTTTISATEGALVTRDAANWSLALACEDLVSSDNDRWRGLDPQLGETPVPQTILPGRAGIPTAYTSAKQ